MNGQGIAANRWLTAFVSLFAVLALVVSIDMSQAGASPSADAAKKKCKKKGKKKKCKKKVGGAAPTAPPFVITPPKPPAPPPPPTDLRADLFWPDGNVDMDLHVWDQVGNHTGYADPPGGVFNGIPGTVHSGDVELGEDGSEAFLDFTIPSTRALTFGVCYTQAQGPPPADAPFELLYYEADGTEVSIDDVIDLGEDSKLYNPDGAFAPAGDWC